MAIFSKSRVDLHQDVLVHDLADEGDGKERFDPRGGVGDDGDRAGRGDGGDRGVADRAQPRLVVDRPREVGKGAPRPGQFPGGGVPLVIDELHHLLAEGDRLRGVVGDPEQDQHVRPPHDAEADLPVGPWSSRRSGGAGSCSPR